MIRRIIPDLLGVAVFLAVALGAMAMEPQHPHDPRSPDIAFAEQWGGR